MTNKIAIKLKLFDLKNNDKYIIYFEYRAINNQIFVLINRNYLTNYKNNCSQ